ncbi:AMP-binding protein [Rhodobacterales bacterium HKCCSP123]|nr:AMP-binding protein [Rhodobacterales bacterium HKCCSP123]
MAPTEQANSVGLKFLQTAERCPDHLAIVTEDAMINYEDLADAVLRMAGRLRSHGVGLDSVVALDGEDFLVVVQTILACSLLGSAWMAMKTLRAVPGVVEPTHLLAVHDTECGDGSGVLRIDQSWLEGPKLEGNYADNPGGPLIFAVTSGTTGTPKMLSLSQEKMLLRAKAAADDFRERETVFCSLFRPIAFPYITRFLAAFVNGATVVQSRNIDFWRACGVNHLYGSVKQVADFMGDAVLSPKFPMIHVSGSKLRDGLALQLLQSFDVVVDLYASTETNRSFKNLKSLGEDGAVETTGLPLDSEVQIVDDGGNPLPDGEVGYVRIRNSYLAGTYLNAPDAATKSFRDGWFYSGDMGVFGPRRDLRILGRTGDVINTGGTKVNASAIDDFLLEQEGIADAMCFEHPNENGSSEIFAFLVLAAGTSLNDVAARAAGQCRRTLGAARTPKRMIAVAEVPRAHDGGAKRSECLALYRSLSGEKNGVG